MLMPARKNQGLVNLMVLGLKHSEKDLVRLYNKECSVEYVWQMFSSCCIADDESAIKHISSVQHKWFIFFTNMTTNTGVIKRSAQIVHIYIE